MPKVRFAASTILAAEHTGLDAPLQVRRGYELELTAAALSKLEKILAPGTMEVVYEKPTPKAPTKGKGE